MFGNVGGISHGLLLDGGSRNGRHAPAYAFDRPYISPRSIQDRMSLCALGAPFDHVPMPCRLTRIVTVAQPFCFDAGVTFARIERTLVSARQRGADLVVFPECALGGYIREPSAGES